MHLIPLRTVLLLVLTCLLPSLAWAKSSSDQPIYLYLSPGTTQYLKANELSYDAVLGRWRRYLKKYGKVVKEIGRDQLLSGPEAGLLVLASAQVLDVQERKAIDNFALMGGSVIGTGAVGSREVDGKLLGYEYLQSTFKVKVYGHFSANEEWFLMPFGGGPLTWPLGAGRRMSLGKIADNTLLRIHSDNLAAVAMNWARSRDDMVSNGVIAFHESDASRYVYFAFSESAWGFHKLADMNAMLDSTVAWLRREPRVYKSDWPDGRVAAQLIEMDTEDKFFSAPNFADHLEKIGVKGTFYCLTSEAIKYPEVVKDLLKRGHEIAYHADTHIGFKGQSPLEQETRLSNMKAQLQSILGANTAVATGFRAPTESYDATTEVLLRKAGIRHHAADPSASTDRLPFFSGAEPGLGPDQALVVLPRTQYDDVNFKRLQYLPAGVDLILENDLDLTVMSGALGLLSVHTQNYVENGLMYVTMGSYMNKVAAYKDKLWVARGDQIAEWWRQREYVNIKSVAEGVDIRLQVEVSGSGNYSGITALVTNPVKSRTPLVLMPDGRAAKVVVKKVDPYRTAIIFDLLPAGSSSYLIRFP
jgi:Polysaccharide deacetylase